MRELKEPIEFFVGDGREPPVNREFTAGLPSLCRFAARKPLHARTLYDGPNCAVDCHPLVSNRRQPFGTALLQ